MTTLASTLELLHPWAAHSEYAATTAGEGHETTTYEHCVMDDTLALRSWEPNDVGELEGPVVLQKH